MQLLTLLFLSFGAAAQPIHLGSDPMSALRQVHRSMDADAIGGLYDVYADRSVDLAVRERALTVATQIASRSGRAGELRDWLRSDLGARSSQARPSSLAALSLLDEWAPPDPIGAVAVDVVGDVALGERITLVITRTARQPATRVQTRVVSPDGQRSDTPAMGVVGGGERPQPLARGEVSRVAYDLFLDEPGSHRLQVWTSMSADQHRADVIRRFVDIEIPTRGIGTAQVIDALRVDADGDGVHDVLDDCAGTPAKLPVEHDGCPVQQPHSR